MKKIIKNNESTEKIVDMEIIFTMDKYFEKGILHEKEKEFSFVIKSSNSWATNIEVKNKDTRKAIEPESFISSLGGKDNVIDINSELFNEHFNILGFVNDTTIILDSFTNETNDDGGTLEINFKFDKGIDANGKPLSDEEFIRTAKFDYASQFKFESSTYTIKGIQDEWVELIDEIHIPERINDKEVKNIAASAFENNEKIRKISLPDSLLSIGSRAFAGLKKLDISELVISDNTTEFGEAIFANSENIDVIKVPKSWDDNPETWRKDYKGNYVVRDRKTIINDEQKAETTIHIEQLISKLTNTSSIGVIENKELLSKLIPENINSFPSSESFAGETKFEIINSENIDTLTKKIEIKYDKYWDDNGNTIENSEKSFDLIVSFVTDGLYNITPDGELTGLIDGYAESPEWNDGNIIIPSKVNKISSDAFKDNDNIKTINILGDLTSIGDEAFYKCNSLTEINSPNNLSTVESIGKGSFEGCENLISKFNFEHVSSLGASAFKGASKLQLNNLQFLETMEEIQDYTFEGASSIDAELKLPETVKIGINAFKDAKNIWTNNSGLNLNKTTSIGENAFDGTNEDQSNENTKADEKYIKCISVRGKEKDGAKDLFTNHDTWSQGYWNEEQTNIYNLDVNIDQIELGNNHSAAIVDGVMYTWGSNNKGGLGIGSDEPGSIDYPVKVKNNPDSGFENINIQKMSLGSNNSAAIQNGVLYMWGSNEVGKLGIGSSNPYVSLPTKAAWEREGTYYQMPNKNVSQVSLGSKHSAAIEDGKLYTWGNNLNGQLGIGEDATETMFEYPVLAGACEDFGGENKKVTQVSLGASHSIAIAGGKMYAWGYNNNGQLGIGSTESKKSPAKVIFPETEGVELKITQISAAANNSAAIVDNEIYIWGNNTNYQLATQTTGNRTKPGKVTNMPSNDGDENIIVSLGENYSSAIQNGVLYMWGSNTHGQLGIGSKSQKVSTPTKVGQHDLSELVNENISSVSLGNLHSGIIKNGVLYMWGNNSYGQLGLGSKNEKLSPTKVKAWSAPEVINQTIQSINNGFNYNIKNLRENININKKQTKK
ncbi:MAG: leucine-rich repeat protein [Mycoplasma sp.]